MPSSTAALCCAVLRVVLSCDSESPSARFGNSSTMIHVRRVQDGGGFGGSLFAHSAISTLGATLKVASCQALVGSALQLRPSMQACKLRIEANPNMMAN